MLKWGIIGTGNIAKKFVQGLKAVKEAELYAVASREYGKAEQFVRAHGGQKPYGSYEDLIEDPDIDAVYISTPHPYHYENAIAALKGKKAVLCEKPFVMNARQAEEVIKTARDHHVFLMEAMWTRFLPVTMQVKAWMDQGKIGQVKMINGDFGFRTEWNPEGRLLNKALGGGALLDVGVYPISYATMLLGTQVTDVKSTASIGETGVDEQAAILLKYETGPIAVLQCAVRTQLMTQAIIFGTEGKIIVPNFFNATEASLYVNHKEPEHIKIPHQANGYEYEILEVVKCMEKGEVESIIMPHEESLHIMRMMDSIRYDWNLKYECDY